jgi:hypothetical protein
MVRPVCILHAVYPTDAHGGGGGNFEQTGLAREIANRVWAWFYDWKECRASEIYNELGRRRNHAGGQ